MESASLTEKEIEAVWDEKALCPFCIEPTNVEAWKNRIIEHLIITIDIAGHIHVHGPVNNEKIMRMLIDAAEKETKKQAS
jgi:hypothetical protein